MADGNSWVKDGGGPVLEERVTRVGARIAALEADLADLQAKADVILRYIEEHPEAVVD